MHGGPEGFHGAGETAVMRMLRVDDGRIDVLHRSRHLRKPAGFILMPDIEKLPAARREKACAMLLAQTA